MAVEPQNIIQVQSRLQDPMVRNEDLVKYANGSNPEVPSFLALIEMNRRKQITNNADAFNQSSKASIKDQVTSALTQPQAGTIPTANPFTSNIAAAAPGVNMAGNPASADITQGIAGINPGAMPAQPVTAPIKPITGAAEGGLMSLPVGHFDQQNYAGGGIVAFGDPALNPNEDQVVPKPKSGFEGILSSLPKMEAPVEKTQEELYAAKRERDRLAGVAADPYADVKAREKVREERQQGNYEQQGMDRLLAQLAAFATADPAKGPGYAGAVSAKASADLNKEQNMLRDKEEAAQIEFARGIAKEEDARKRGDSDGIKAALDAQQKAKFDYAKVEHDRGVLAAHIYQTDEYSKARKQAASDAAANKPDPDDVMYNRIMAKAENDSTMKMLNKKQETLDIGSEEYNAVEREKYRRLKEIYFAKRPDLLGPEPSPAQMAPQKKDDNLKWWQLRSKMEQAKNNTIQPGWTVQQNP